MMLGEGKRVRHMNSSAAKPVSFISLASNYLLSLSSGRDEEVPAIWKQ
jgi:hypothetical protein